MVSALTGLNMNDFAHFSSQFVSRDFIKILLPERKLSKTTDAQRTNNYRNSNQPTNATKQFFQTEVDATSAKLLTFLVNKTNGNGVTRLDMIGCFGKSLAFMIFRNDEANMHGN